MRKNQRHRTRGLRSSRYSQEYSVHHFLDDLKNLEEKLNIFRPLHIQDIYMPDGVEVVLFGSLSSPSRGKQDPRSDLQPGISLIGQPFIGILTKSFGIIFEWVNYKIIVHIVEIVIGLLAAVVVHCVVCFVKLSTIIRGTLKKAYGAIGGIRRWLDTRYAIGALYLKT